MLLRLQQGMRHVRGRHAKRRQPHRIRLDPHFALNPAHALEFAGAGYGEDGLGHRIIDEPAQGFLVHARGRDGIHERRIPTRGDRTDGRLLHGGGQLRADAVHRILGFDQRIGEVLLQHELHGDGDLAIGDRRTQMAQAG